jgi:hypothetical protein
MKLAMKLTAMTHAAIKLTAAKLTATKLTATKLTLCGAIMLAAAAPAAAQVDGYVSVMADVLPDLHAAPGAQRVSEIRTRVFLERSQAAGEHLRLQLSGYVDGLAAARNAVGAPGATTAAIVRPADLYAEVVMPSFDLRIGAARLAWGRLDEFQPTDVVNPIDLTRFLLEGRSEARLAAAMVRGRIFLPRSSTIEAVVVPAFAASRFDQLEEESSPFNLALAPGVRTERREPELGWNTMQGGARFTTTTARVDWAVAAYRGFRTFPTLTLLQTFAPPTTVVQTFPRFTMIGGDIETVRGAWGVRGEAAFFVDDTIQRSEGIPRGVEGRSMEAGAGADRRAGNYRLAGNLLWSWNSIDGSGVSLVAAADRSFARETRTLRVFAVYDPGDATVFGRIIGAVSLRDNVWLEGSGGVFTGSSLDTLGRLTRRDFAYTRLKIYL